MRLPRYAWTVVALLWVVSLLNYLDRQVIFSVLPMVKSDLSLSNTELGMIGTAFLWVYGIFSPIAGYLADRMGRVRCILLALLIWSGVTWATGHAHSLNELLAARGLMGLSEAFYLPAALALIADFHGEGSRALATGIHFSGTYVGIVAGGFGGGWVGERFGWRAAFGVLGLFGVAYAGFLKLTLRSPRKSEAKDVPKHSLPAAIRELVSLPGFLPFTLVFSAFSCANWVVYAWLPLYLYEHFRMSLSAAGFAATFYIQIGSVAGVVLGGKLADQWVRRSRRGRMWAQAAGLGVAAPFLFLTGSTSSFTLFIAATLMFGVGRGVFDCNAMPVLCQIARPELRSTGYGIYNCVGCLAGGVMTLLAGALKATLGLSASFQLVAVILIISAVSLWRLRLDGDGHGGQDTGEPPAKTIAAERRP